MDTAATHPAVAAARRTAALIADPAVAAAWDAPAVLAGYRVGGLAAHLARAVETVRGYLDAPAPGPEAALLDAPAYYATVLGHHDPLDSDLHRGVRARGEARVGAGHAALVADVEEAAAWLAAQPLDPDRPVSVFAGTAMRLEDYLDTRLVEMLVHGRDLAASVALPLPSYDEEAWRRVADVLTRATAARHGWRGLALGLARPELGVGAFTVGPLDA